MLKVMTPLWGTKHSSALVGAKSDGDRRAARSLLSCALWRGMGRLWRGMGGMGRPEPLATHHPHQQQRHSGFHETRDTAFMAAVPAVKSRLPGSLLPTIAHYCPALLPPSCCCPPSPAIARHFPAFLPSGHSLPAHDGPILPAICPRLPMMARYCSLKILPGSSLQAPSVILGRPHDALPPPQFPPPSGLVPLRPAHDEPMLRKENIPDCTNSGTFYLALTFARLESPLRSGHHRGQRWSGTVRGVTRSTTGRGLRRRDMPCGQETISKR